MNKKVSIFYITTVAVAIACLILDLILNNPTFSFLEVCFAITMIIYGICLIVRGLRFKIDSSLFLGIIIFVFGIIATMTYFTSLKYGDLWHWLLLGISLASVITGVYFKINGQKKMAVLFLGLFILALLFQFKVYKWWVMLITMSAWVAGFIINNILHNRRK